MYIPKRIGRIIAIMRGEIPGKEKYPGPALRAIRQILSDRRIKREKTVIKKTAKILSSLLCMEIGEDLAARTLKAVRRWELYRGNVPRSIFFYCEELPLRIISAL